MVLSSVCANKTTSSSCGAAAAASAAAVDCVFCEEKKKNVDVAVDVDCDRET